MFKSFTVTIRTKYSRTYSNFTGKISKTVLLFEMPDLQPMFQPYKGFLKPIHVSPLIDEHGSPVFPYYHKGSLKGTDINGTFKFKVGVPHELAEVLFEKFKEDVGVRNRTKFENELLEFVIVDVKEDRYTLPKRFKLCFSPSLLIHPLLVNRDIRKFLPTPSAVFWVPYSLLRGDTNVSKEEVLSLEEGIVETWKNRLKTIWIPYDGNKEPVLIGKVEYIVLKEDLMKVVETALIMGVGASRASGFGHVEICDKERAVIDEDDQENPS